MPEQAIEVAGRVLRGAWCGGAGRRGGADRLGALWSVTSKVSELGALWVNETSEKRTALGWPAGLLFLLCSVRAKSPVGKACAPVATKGDMTEVWASKVTGIACWSSTRECDRLEGSSTDSWRNASKSRQRFPRLR